VQLIPMLTVFTSFIELLHILHASFLYSVPTPEYTRTYQFRGDRYRLGLVVVSQALFPVVCSPWHRTCNNNTKYKMSDHGNVD